METGYWAATQVKESVAKERSKSHEIRGMVARINAKADWRLPVLWYTWYYTEIWRKLRYIEATMILDPERASNVGWR
jgi:hypothetical protein